MKILRNRGVKYLLRVTKLVMLEPGLQSSQSNSRGLNLGSRLVALVMQGWGPAICVIISGSILFDSLSAVTF